MSQRQGRRSLGLAPLLPPNETGPTEIQKFEEFRRKHSRQNKDIIMENINRKAIIKDLQDEVARLRNQLLAVKQANRRLQAQVKSVQREAGNLGGQQVRDALDQLITAFPALCQLRDVLNIIQPISSQPNHAESSATTTTNRRPSIDPVENTYATRPAEMARQTHGLGDLAEGSEQESEVGETERLVPIRINGRRSSESGSVSASRSPRRQTRKVYLDEADSSPLSSPAKSASPSPKKHSTGPRKQRRRRESGLLLLPQQTETRTRRSPSPVAHTNEDCVVVEAGDQEQADSEWEEGGALDIRPEEAAALVSSCAGNDISMPPEGVVMTSSVKDTEVLDTIKEASGSEGGSGSSRTHGRSGSAELADQELADSLAAEENAAMRGRRARSSVNYKEPSLNKKMRKPDGISAEETLKPVSRKSVASSSRRGTPKKGGDRDALSVSPAPPVPSLPLDLGSANMLSASIAVTIPKQTGMRRKSVLPTKSSTGANPRRTVNYLEEEDDEDDPGREDADDVDDLIDVDMENWDDVKEIEEKTASSRVVSPVKSGRPVSAAVDVVVTRPAGSSATAPTSKAPVKGRTSSFRPTTSSITTLTTASGSSLINDTAHSTISNSSTASSSNAKARSMASLGLGNGRPVMPSTARSLSGPNPSSSAGSGVGSRNFTPTGRVVSREKKSSTGSLSETNKEREKAKEQERGRDILAETDGANQPSPTETITVTETDEPEKKLAPAIGSGSGSRSALGTKSADLGYGLGLGSATGSITTVKERVLSRGRSVSGGTGTTSRRRQSALT
ncbi:hypothetical protein IAU59_001412 [Kwoniella sp. CBS 9459]